MTFENDNMKKKTGTDTSVGCLVPKVLQIKQTK